MNRPYLVFCSVNGKKFTPELFGPTREFDVALHDYSPESEQPTTKTAEYFIHSPAREKFETAAKLLPGLPDYKGYAFLDDDLTISTSELNQLFRAGDALRFPLYQPALTPTSYGSHPHLYAYSETVARRVPFVEIMCPFFSEVAFQSCLWTFSHNASAWGLDCYLWPGLVNGECFVIDRLAIGHYRKPGRRDRKLHNGLTPYEELKKIELELKGPKDIILEDF